MDGLGIGVDRQTGTAGVGIDIAPLGGVGLERLGIPVFLGVVISQQLRDGLSFVLSRPLVGEGGIKAVLLRVVAWLHGNAAAHNVGIAGNHARGDAIETVGFRQVDEDVAHRIFNSCFYRSLQVQDALHFVQVVVCLLSCLLLNGMAGIKILEDIEYLCQGSGNHDQNDACFGLLYDILNG